MAPGLPEAGGQLHGRTLHGGNGTWKFALRYPEKFAACAMLSAPVPDFKARYEAELASGRRSHISDQVDAYGGLENLLASKENIYGAAEKLARKGELARLPRLFAAVGEDDGVYQNVLRAAEDFRALGIELELKTVPGYAHEWRFWDLTIQDALAFFGFRVRT